MKDSHSIHSVRPAAAWEAHAVVRKNLAVLVSP